MTLTTPYSPYQTGLAELIPRTAEGLELPDFQDRFRSIVGRYYQNVQLIPFIPDVYTVAYTESALLRGQGLMAIDRMLLDDMVEAGISSWIGNVLTDARVVPADDTKEAKDVAEFFTEQFERLPGGLISKLFSVLFGVAYGFSVSTIPLEIVKQGRWRGYIGMADIHWLMPHFLEPIHDDRGIVVGWQQLDTQSGTSELFDQDEVVHYVRRPEKDAARGLSILLPAHRHWATKELLIRLRNHQAELALGRIMMKHTDSTKISKKDFERYSLDIGQNWINRFALLIYEGMSAEYIKSDVGPDVFNEPINHANRGILRSIGVSYMLQEEPEFGNRALGDAQMKFSDSSKFRPIRQNFASLFQHSGINRICKINHFPQRHWPKFAMSSAVEEDRQEQIKLYLQARQNNDVNKIPADENWIRAGIKAPLVKEGQTAPAPELSETLSLNGAQIQSAVGIIVAVGAGQIPPESASAMLTGFLPIPASIAAAIVNPFATFKATPQAPKPGAPVEPPMQATDPSASVAAFDAIKGGQFKTGGGRLQGKGGSEDNGTDAPDRSNRSPDSSSDIEPLSKDWSPPEDMAAHSSMLDADQASAFRDYSGIRAADMNAKMRNRTPLSPAEQATASKLSGAIEQHGDLKEPATVYRGMNFRDGEERDKFLGVIKTGTEFRNSGFYSTSTDPKVARPFAHDDKGVVFEIKAKRGIYMDGKLSHSPHERELLINHKSKMRITGQSKRKVAGREITVVHMEQLE